MKKELPPDVSQAEQAFERKKQEYFTKIGLQMRSALALHKAAGLWQKDNEGERGWRNVSEHCLVEVARTRTLATMLGLKESVSKKLMNAAALHDFFKKGQKQITVAGGLNRAAFAEATQQADGIMRDAKIPEEIIRLVNAVGDESLLETKKILEKDELSEDDIAFLIMHYVDDYTIGSNWVHASEVKDTKEINDLDRRMNINEANLRYQKLNEEGRAIFGGETAYQAERRIGHIVEEKLADLVKKRGDITVDPIKLPEIIDQKIKEEIRREVG